MTTKTHQPDTTRILTRVRALLAKAESTTFEEEAEALTTKAQELITRYALSDALVQNRARLGEAPASIVVHLDRPYLDAKARLLTAVASANQCRVVFTNDWSEGTLFGFPADLEGVEVLYTSLLVQATRSALSLGPVRDGFGRNRTRSFRRAFLLGFAFRIGERLEAARSFATADMEAQYATSLHPVLADRSARVEEAMRAAFPNTVTRRAMISHAGGLAEGRAAADRADLSSSLPTPPRLRLVE